MTPDVVTAAPSQTLGDALELMRKHEIHHLPITDAGRLVGLVTERDLRIAGPVAAAEPERREPMSDSMPLHEVMQGDVVTVRPDQTVEEAATLLYRHRIGCLPVQEDGRLVGILTEGDLLRALVELLQGRQPATRIEMLMPDRPGELARVVRVIGIDFGINISGLVMPPPTGDRALAILHLNAEDVTPLLERLERLGYEVGSPSLERIPD